MPGIIDPTKMYLFFGAMGEFRSVDITPVTSAGDGTTVNCTKAIRGKVKYSVSQGLMASAYVRPEAMYSIPIAVAPGPWKAGDKLYDSLELNPYTTPTNGLNYTIIDAQHDEGFWLLTVFSPQIAFNLQHLIDVYQVHKTKDAAGSIINDGEPSELYLDVPARVQWGTGRRNESDGVIGTGRDATVILGQRLELNHNCLIKWTDPLTSKSWSFELTEWSGADRIDQTMEAKVQVLN